MRRPLALSTLPAAFLLLTACGSGAFSNPFVQQINVTLSPSALTLAPGANSRVQVTGVAEGTTTQLTGLNIKASDVPADLTVTPSTGAVTVAAASGAKEGTYSIPLDITTTGGKGQAVLAVTVATAAATPATVNFSPSEVTLNPGQTLPVAALITRSGATVQGARIVSVTGALGVKLDASDPLGFEVSATGAQTLGSYVLQVTTTDSSNRTQVSNLSVTVEAKTQ